MQENYSSFNSALILPAPYIKDWIRLSEHGEVVNKQTAPVSRDPFQPCCAHPLDWSTPGITTYLPWGVWFLLAAQFFVQFKPNLQLGLKC